MLRNLLGLVAVIATLVAARPWFMFLILPPEGRESEWLGTVIALGVLGACWTISRQLREPQDGPSSSR